MSIENIIHTARNGNQTSIKLLYERNVNAMFNTSYRITNDVQLSEDIFQESFIISIDKLGTLNNIENYQGWLRRIVINLSLKHVTKRKTFDCIEENTITTIEENKLWYKNIPIEVIKDAIQLLPDRSRTVFSLYAIEGYKHKEVANMLHISDATSKSQYRYAKKLLRAYLTKKYTDEI